MRARVLTCRGADRSSLESNDGPPIRGPTTPNTSTNSMINENPIPEVLHGFMMQSPVLVVCLVAAVVILTKWSEASLASLWALLGFGLALALCFAIPIGQAAVRHWVTQNGNPAQLGAAFTSLAVFWSVLRAISYGLLLMAVFAGRSLVPGSALSHLSHQ